jgi:hypothetical protein
VTAADGEAPTVVHRSDQPAEFRRDEVAANAETRRD